MLNELEHSEEKDRQRVLEEAMAIVQGNDNTTVDNKVISNTYGDQMKENELNEGENFVVTIDTEGQVALLKDNSHGDGQDGTTLQPGWLSLFCLVHLRKPVFSMLNLIQRYVKVINLYTSLRSIHIFCKGSCQQEIHPTLV